MRLTLRQLAYIREVARLGSISSACESLRISASSILAAVRIAEEETGSVIFVRRAGHGVVMTPAGQKFLVSVRRFLAAGDDFERSMHEFTSLSPQTIRVGCFAPFGGLLVPPVLRRYMQAQGNCEITLLEGDQTELRHWLAEGDVDLVLTYDIGDDFAASITPICRFPTHAIMRVDDPLAEQESVTMDELARRPLILLDLPETRTYLLTLFDFASRKPQVGLRTRSYETVRVAVVNGLGISLMNMRPHSEASPDSQQLIRVPISDPLRQPTLIVADLYGDQKPGYVRSFIRTLYQYVAEVGPRNLAVVLDGYADGLLHRPPG